MEFHRTAFSSLVRRSALSLLLTFSALPSCWAGAPQATFLPPQSIPLPGTMTFSKVVVVDVNGDHYDDLVAIGTDATDGLVIDVYLNEGKTRASTEAVNFIRQRLVLKDHPNTDAITDKVKFSGGFDLQVVDLDNDGNPDILASDAATGEIFVLWNQSANAPAPFVFVPDTSDPTAPSMTFYSPLAMDGSFGSTPGTVLGTPIQVAAVDLKDGSGRKSIVAYHGSLQLDPSSTQHSPFNQRNYESLAIIYPSGTSGRGFDIVKQRAAWPGCDLSFGSTCTGWADGINASKYTPLTGLLYNFRIADKLRLNFDAAASDVLTMDSTSTVSGVDYYTPAVMRPNASPGLQVLAGQGPNGSDAVWLQGGGKINEFVVDNGLKLMRRRTVINTVLGNERSAGATLGALSTGQNVLITAGGMRVMYDPSNPASAVDQTVPDYLNRAGQVGAWLGWASLDAGPALMSLSDYCRDPDPCAKQFYWPHAPLDGSAPSSFSWGGARTLVMLDLAQETSTPSGKQFAPFFQKPDEGHFQAFTIRGGGIPHKPFIASGHFASPSETALIMLDHADGVMTDPTWNHFSLFRPDTAKTYVSPTPHLDGLTVGRFISMGLADVGLTLPQGEISAVLVGSHLGTDTADGIRYVTVHQRDPSTDVVGVIVGVFPANPAETVKEIHKDGIVVPGLSTLPAGTYALEVHNATATASMNLNVANSHGITTTDYDWRAGNTCGLLPNTKDGNLWPKQIAVTVTNFSGSVQAVRWINQDDGSVVNLGSEGGTYDATTSKVTLIVPQGKLKDGKWRPAIKANEIWQPVGRIWNVTHDSAALAFCATQVNLVNEEAYSQVDNDNYFLDPAQYKVWPHIATGSFRFFGSGFASNNIQSAAIKQGDHRFFSLSLVRMNDNEVDIEFGDLSKQLVPGMATELYFYSETADVVQAEGVPAAGEKSWRTPRAGTGIPKMPEVGNFLNTGSGPDGAWQSGDVIQVAAKNALYPIPSAMKLLLKGDDGTIYMLEDPHLPDDWYSHHYGNDNLVLYFTVPEDLSTHVLKTGSSIIKPSYSADAGSVALTTIEGRALATAGISDSALAYMMAESSVPVVAVGAITAGSIALYTGNNPATWFKQEWQLFTKKITDAPPDVTAGLTTDDQPRAKSNLYWVGFVSQPKADVLDGPGPVDIVIVKAQTATEALAKAKYSAIPAFVATNYFIPGSVDALSSLYFNPPSSGATAASFDMGFVGPDGTNPKGLIFKKGMSRFDVHLECGDFVVDSYIDTPVPYNDGASIRRHSVLWRRAVAVRDTPPVGCGSHFVDRLGDERYYLEIPDRYITDDRNDYTKF